MSCHSAVWWTFERFQFAQCVVFYIMGNGILGMGFQTISSQRYEQQQLDQGRRSDRLNAITWPTRIQRNRREKIQRQSNNKSSNRCVTKICWAWTLITPGPAIIHYPTPHSIVRSPSDPRLSKRSYDSLLFVIGVLWHIIKLSKILHACVYLCTLLGNFPALNI